MRLTNNDVFHISVASVGALLIGIWFMLPDGEIKTADTDGPGPNMMIEVGGNVSGLIVIDLEESLAPNNVARLVDLTEAGAYNEVAFHRVIDGFMVQTGDVQFGKISGDTSRAGVGKSDLPNVNAEFSDVPFVRGIVGMARGPDANSANSQFFIMYDTAASLNGQYTVVGHVVRGMELVDQIKKGDSETGAVDSPDFMASVWIDY